ncbi:MAG: hypothetical protein PHP50_10355 [Lachnospiraceae bacterium]|nr:hypothetical protein [Lachnospiraceae bacterium]
MKTSELEKILKENSCELIRNGSNHDIWISHITNKQESTFRKYFRMY